MRKSTGEINAEILAPFFEIVTKITCETTIKLNVLLMSGGESPYVCWYADWGNQKYGGILDHVLIDDDMSEDRVVAWLTELKGMYAEWMGTTEPETDRESLGDIAAYENHRIDSMEKGL